MRTMIKIGIYTRKSVYSDKSDSTQAQYNIGIEYCKSHYENYEVFRYEDEGFTGANTKRPGYSRLVSDIEENKLNVIICYKIDRISRNIADFSNFFNTLTRHNVEFVSIKEQIDTSTPIGRAMMYICSVFAQMERETTAERVKDNMIELSKSGKWAGGRAPLGFSRERVAIDGKFHTTLIENPEDISLLSFISDTFLNNNFSLNRLEKYFRENGITTTRGFYFSSTQIYNILRNPIYCCADQAAYDYFSNLGCTITCERDKFDGTYGIMPYGRTQGGGGKKIHTVNPPEKWIISVGLHKPLWSSEKYIAIQSRFGNNKIAKIRKHKIGILKGIVRCSCGYTMRVQHKIDKTYNKTYDNYFCTQRDRRGINYCNRKFVSVEKLDEAAIEILKKIKFNKSLIDDYIEDLSINNTFRSCLDVQRDINQIESKISNLATALSSNSGSSAAKYIISEIEKLDRKLSELKYEEMEINTVRHKQIETEYDKEMKYKMICEIVDNLENFNYDEINGLLKDLFKECIYDGESLHIKI